MQMHITFRSEDTEYELDGECLIVRQTLPGYECQETIIPFEDLQQIIERRETFGSSSIH